MGSAGPSLLLSFLGLLVAGSVEAARTPWPDWPGTRYEAKALREGRKPAYLGFRRSRT